MIVLDTNVISAMMARREDIAVTRWLDRQQLGRFCTTVISIHELRYGLARLAPGRRRATLGRTLDQILAEFAERILVLDAPAANASGQLQAEREAAGRPIGLADCLIAGIAISRGAAIATRNVRDFADAPIEVINPWAT